jgi:predicted patatin/cPLA2 family phospholipase
MERDVVIISEGGTIQGIFGIGVLSSLQKHNIYPRLHSIYAVSSGAHSAAYFLSEKLNVGAQIYYDYLMARCSFLKHLPTRIIFWKIWDLFIHKKPFNIIDLGFIEDLEKNTFKLALTKIQTSPINFYIKVFNVKTLRVEYLDAKENTIEKLACSSKVPPYSYSHTKTGTYYDGGIMPTKDFLHNIVRKQTDKKIIYIFNDKKTWRKTSGYLPTALLDTLFKARYLGWRYGLKHLCHLYSYTYVKDLKKYKNVIYVYDETGNPRRAKNKAKFFSAYELGKKKGEYIMSRLREMDKEGLSS